MNVFRFAWIVLVALSLTTLSLRAAEGDGEEYEPPPEGYEERYYPLDNLILPPTNFSDAGDAPANGPLLRDEQVIEIVKTCAVPDTWTRRGPARIEAQGLTLRVLHRKEAHDEIAKVMAWLRGGTWAKFRATLIVAPLKAETIRALAKVPGTIPPADLAKALDEAGDAAETLELRGVEGQEAFVRAVERQTYIRDIDATGGVFDNIVPTLTAGLTASVVGYRSPDGSTVQLDLKLHHDGPAVMEKRKLELALSRLDTFESTSIPVGGGKEKGKDDEKVTVTIPGHSTPALVRLAQEIQLPTQKQGLLNATLHAPQDAFVLAGVLDYSLAEGGNAPTRTAVFVRAAIDGGPTTLTGVSGLKEGETFKLYPLVAASRELPSFEPLKEDGSPRSYGAVANPFAAPTNNPNLDSQPVKRAKQMFTERVRKNKIVETMGPFAITRLNDADNATFLKSLNDDLRRGKSSVRTRVVAVAIDAASHRKLLLAAAPTFDRAAVDATTALPGAQILADAVLIATNGQRAQTATGFRRSILTDTDVSGDAQDPIIDTIRERGYALELKPTWGGEGSTVDMEVRLTIAPGASTGPKQPLEMLSMQSGASSTVLGTMKLEIDPLKMGQAMVRSIVAVPVNGYTLAGSTRMPPAADGKPDPRYLVVFVGIE